MGLDLKILALSASLRDTSRKFHQQSIKAKGFLPKWQIRTQGTRGHTASHACKHVKRTGVTPWSTLKTSREDLRINTETDRQSVQGRVLMCFLSKHELFYLQNLHHSSFLWKLETHWHRTHLRAVWAVSLGLLPELPEWLRNLQTHTYSKQTNTRTVQTG